jgi:outer membrane lipoprotein SlyB
MTTNPSSIAEQAGPGAVPKASANPVVWWVAGGLGVLGAGALAAALTTQPASEPVPAKPGTPVAAKPAPVKVAKGNPASTCSACGTVESVKAEKHKGEGTGLGAVGGAVVGGVVGHQMGGGDGKKALTVLGAVGGGLAGHEIEKQVRSTTVYQVTLRMDDGSHRTVTQSAAPAVGARFEVQGQNLKPLAAAKG